MTDKPRRKPGPYGPGATVYPLELLGSPAVPPPNQTSSGFGLLHGTTTSSEDVDICSRVSFHENPTDATDGPQALTVTMAAAFAVAGAPRTPGALVAGVSWVEGIRARSLLLFVLIQFQGSVCCWIWELLCDEAPAYGGDFPYGVDPGDSPAAGVREPIAKPPLLPCAVMALPIPAPEPEAENAFGVGLKIAAGVPVTAGASALQRPVITVMSNREEIMRPYRTEVTAKVIDKSAMGQWSSARRAAAYVRVSARGQDEDSLEAQREACMKRADDDGLLVSPDRVYRERRTGSGLDRPILEPLRRAVRASEVGAVYVDSADRLSRDLLYFLMLRNEFKSAGVAIRFVKEQIDGRVKRAVKDGLLVDLAHVYQEQLSGADLDRTRLGQLLQAAQAGEVDDVYVYVVDRLPNCGSAEGNGRAGRTG